MELSRISALLEPFLDRPLSAQAVEQISTYIDLLLRWNARINLTSVRDPDSIVTRHFGESFFLARHVLPTRQIASSDSSGVPRPSRSVLGSERAGSPVVDQGTQHARFSGAAVVDIGSGAGFPGLPLKIWAPAIPLTLIESNHKKATFLREVSRALTLTDVNVISERAETLTGRLPLADLVMFRAVEHFESIVPLAARFRAPSGRLAILIGSAQLPALTKLVPQLSWQAPIDVPHSSSRVLAISEPASS